MSEHHSVRVPPVSVPALHQPASAYRTAHQLLSSSAPREALEVLEPALTEDPGNTGLRSLRAWAFLQRAQLQRAEEDRTTSGRGTPSAGAWSASTASRRRCRTCGWPPR